MHKQQRPLSSCAKKCRRTRSPQARDQTEPRAEKRASSGAERQQQCVSQPCAPQEPPITAAAAHVWPARRAPPRATSTLVARGTTEYGGGGSACSHANSKEVVQPVAVSPARGQAHPRAAALMRSHTSYRRHQQASCDAQRLQPAHNSFCGLPSTTTSAPPLVRPTYITGARGATAQERRRQRAPAGAAAELHA